MSDNNNYLTQKFTGTLSQIEQMLNYYEGYIAYNPSQYIIDRVKLRDCTITFYKSLVILFQGEGAVREYNHWAEIYGLTKSDAPVDLQYEFYDKSCVGTDEVGTGDFFGPVVVCAAFVTADKISELKKLGVKDSKLLTDDQIFDIGYKLIKMIPYSLIKLPCNKYNTLTGEKNNLNYIKAYLHNKSIISILKKLENVKYDAIIIDEFTPKDLYFNYLKDEPEIIENVNLIKKGERAHVAVAAASIIARLAYLKEMKDLSNKYNQIFPKGASESCEKVAITFAKSNSWDDLYDIAKMKYVNADRIKAYFKENPLPKSKQGKLHPMN